MSTAPATTTRPGVRRPADLPTVPVALVVLGVAVVLTVGLVTMEVPSTANAPGPKVFPIGITVLAYAVGVLLLVQALLGRTSEGARPEPPVPAADPPLPAEPPAPVPGPPGREEAAGPDVSWPRIGLLLGLLLVFALVLEPLGWLLSATGLFLGVTVALGARPTLRALGVAIILAAGVQLVFAGLLGLALPTGFVGGL